jgi:hypothetical protein
MKLRRVLHGAFLLGLQLNWGGDVFADPHLGVDAADAGELHLVGVAVGPVETVQPLHRLLVLVVDQAAHRQQGGADRDRRGAAASTLSARRAEMVWCARPPSRRPPPGAPGSASWTSSRRPKRRPMVTRHVSGDVRQRPFARRAHAHRLLHRVAKLQLQSLGYLARGRHGRHVDHLDRGVQAHGDQVLEQPVQVGTGPWLSPLARPSPMAGGGHRARVRRPGLRSKSGLRTTVAPAHGEP